MSKSHSRNGSPSLPDLDRRRNVLSSGMPEAIVEDVETKRYRELRMANAFQIDHDFYSPRLAEADRMGARIMIDQKRLSPMVDLTHLFRPKILDSSTIRPRNRSKSLTVDALIEFSPAPLHRRTKRSISNVGAFYDRKESLGPSVRFSRTYGDGYDEEERPRSQSGLRLPPISPHTNYSEDIQLKTSVDEDFIPESRPHYPSLADLESSSAGTATISSGKSDNRVLMSKRFLKKSNTSYTAPKPREMTFSPSTAQKPPIKQSKRHKRLPIDTVIALKNPKDLEKKNNLEEDGEEEIQETLRTVRQKLRERVIYELQKDFSKRNIKLSNEDIRAFWSRLKDALEAEIVDNNCGLPPVSSSIATSIKISVVNGRVSTHSAEYISLTERCATVGLRKSLAQFLPYIERLCQDFAVPWAEIDSCALERVLSIYEQNTFKRSLTMETILESFTNKEQMQSFLDFPGQKFKGTGAMERAATKIQAAWLMYRARSHFKKIEPRLKALGLFFKRWTSHKRRTLMRTSIKCLEAFHVRRSEALLENLSAKWEMVKSAERFIVHVPSYYSGIGANEDFQHFIRACDVKDKNVHVIFVFSHPPDENYMETLRTTLGRAVDTERINRNIHIVIPNCAFLFQKRSNLIDILLTSHQSLCEIREIIAGRPAYIVAGMNQIKNYILSSVLELPLVGPAHNTLEKISAPEVLVELQELIPRDEHFSPSIPWDTCKMDIALYFHYYIDPAGAISDLGPSENIKIGDDLSFDLIPAHYFPASHLTGIVVDLATKCFELGVVGFLTLKFIRRNNSIVVAEILPYYNERVLRLQQFLTATNSRYDGDGNYLFDAQKALIPDFSFLTMVKEVVNINEASKKVAEVKPLENRVGIWCDNCYHTNFSTLTAHVFKILVRSMEVDFEEQMRSGTLLIDSKSSYAANVVTFLCITQSFSKSLIQSINVLTIFKRMLHIYGMECQSNLDAMIKKLDAILSGLDTAKGTATDNSKSTAALKGAKMQQASSPGGKRSEGSENTHEEDHMGRSTLQFINPSADLFENPFRKTMGELESKIAFVKNFIATDVLYQVMENVNGHIKEVETKRYNEWVEQKLAALTRTTQQQSSADQRPEQERKADEQFKGTSATKVQTVTPSRKIPPASGSANSRKKKPKQ